MANPTSNFGWQMPTSTDLVTDLPADFETFGQAVDTSLADLKGGTTGQVLAKASNTNMDFTWVAQDDSNAIQNAIVDAKGDLIGATAADTPARLAVGTNGQVLTADSTAATGLAWATPSAGITQAAGKNIIINGGFDIWQRSTSSTSNGYATADRWNRDGANCTTSQQTTGAPNGSRFVMRNAFTSATSAYATQFHFIETAQVVQLWGQTVTLSVKLRRSSGMASNLALFLRKNATVDAGPATGSWNTISSVTVTNASLPTGTTSADWFTATITATIPNDGTANSISIYVSTATEPGNGSYWEIAQAQIELGSAATTFSRAGATIQGELAACQRYYWRRTGENNAQDWFSTFGVAYSTTNATVYFQCPQTMRVKPSAVDYANLMMFRVDTGGQIAITSLSFNNNNPDTPELIAVGGGFLVNAAIVQVKGDGSGVPFIGFSAEL